VHLWLVPTANPDGLAARTRQNAHGVDLNRNWPAAWARNGAPWDGYYSGPRPLSEPETQAVAAFLRRLRPHYVVSLHQPLYGVDTTDGGAVDKAFRNRLARNLGYPLKAFRCWSICHGSLTDWYTVHYKIGETIEFGSHPTRTFLTGRARRGIVAAMGGHFGSLSAHNPRSYLAGRASTTGSVRLTGYAYDIDARGTSVRYAVARDGQAVGTGIASLPSPGTNAKYHLTGGHAISFSTTATPGPHTFCLTFTNIRAGTGDSRRCVAVTVPAPA
jgi:Zinc carboxypeptidase